MSTLRAAAGRVRAMLGTARQGITRRQILITISLSYVLTSLGTMAAFAADDEGHTKTTGFGELIPMPDLAGEGQKTLLESFNPDQWAIPYELTMPLDSHLVVMHFLVSLIWMLNILVAYGVIGISWWLFSVTDVPELGDSISSLIGGSSNTLLEWLFPTSLALGGLVAYLDSKGGSALNQLLWVLISSVLGLSFAMAPNMWVNGVDNARTIGTDAVMTATADGISVDNEYPFEWPEMGESASKQDDLLRKSGDAIWRSLVVTPWCLTSFGSTEACERYGADMLDLKTDEERSDYIKDEIYDRESDDDYSNGKDSPTGQWTKGNQPQNRLPFAIMALVVTCIFALLLLVLGFAAITAVVSGLFLLAVGVYFAMCWMIPGRPRQWGTNWFEALVGTVIMSIIVTMVFGTTLVMLTVVFASTADKGWGPTLGLALVIAVVGFSFRRTLTNILSVGTAAGGRGMGLAGYIALRGLGRALGKMGGSKGRSIPRPPASRPGQMRQSAEDIGPMTRASDTRLSKRNQLGSGRKMRQLTGPGPRSQAPLAPSPDGGPQPQLAASRVPEQLAPARRRRGLPRPVHTVTNARPPATASGSKRAQPTPTARTSAQRPARPARPTVSSTATAPVLEGTVVDEQPQVIRHRSANRMRSATGGRRFRAPQPSRPKTATPQPRRPQKAAAPKAAPQPRVRQTRRKARTTQ